MTSKYGLTVGIILVVALTELHPVIRTRKRNAMRTISLHELLGYDSSDAPGYKVCDLCGESWNLYYGDPRCEHKDYWRAGETVADTIDAKMRDGQFRALVESLDEYGMTTPILVMPGWNGSKVYNGHHRIAWAYLRNIDVVSYVSTWNEYDRAEDETSDVTGWSESSPSLGYGDPSSEYRSF